MRQSDTMAESVAANGIAQYATFSVGGLHFAIGVPDVQEVLRQQEMTRVPLAPPVIEGLINLRGQIVTALDMRRRLNLPDRPRDVEPMSIVVRFGEESVSLQVDDIGDVLELDAALLSPPPDHIGPQVRELICGVSQLPDRLLLVLDTARVVEVDQKH